MPARVWRANSSSRIHANLSSASITLCQGLERLWCILSVDNDHTWGNDVAAVWRTMFFYDFLKLLGIETLPWEHFTKGEGVLNTGLAISFSLYILLNTLKNHIATVWLSRWDGNALLYELPRLSSFKTNQENFRNRMYGSLFYMTCQDCQVQRLSLYENFRSRWYWTLFYKFYVGFCILITHKKEPCCLLHMDDKVWWQCSSTWLAKIVSG